MSHNAPQAQHLTAQISDCKWHDIRPETSQSASDAVLKALEMVVLVRQNL